MKKLLATALAVMMVLTFSVFALASTDSTISFSVYTGDTTKSYNPSYYDNGNLVKKQIYLRLALRDISFGAEDGISAFEFDLYYDKNKVEPVTLSATDDDGDSGVFTKLIKTNPGDWEGFGVLDEEKGTYGLVFSDFSGEASAKADDSLVIQIPFVVKPNVRVNDIVFNFDNVIAYNKNMKKKCEIQLDSVSIAYDVQPSSPAKLPSDSITLDIAGYRHDVVNFIYYAETKTTVTNFVKKYCDLTNGQQKLSDFAILIADTDGIISYVDTGVGSNSNKSSVTIPAGSYIIGVSKANSDDYTAFKKLAVIGDQVTVYNVNIEAAGKSDTAEDLIKAAFIISDPSEGNPPFVGGYDPDEPIVEDDPDISVPDEDDSSDDNSSEDDTSKDDTSNDDTSKDDTSKDDTSKDDTSKDDTSKDDTSKDDTSKGDTSKDDTSKDDTSKDDTSKDDTSKDDTSDTGNTSEPDETPGDIDKEPEDNILLGDVNLNGEIDSLDYILLKRAYFGTFRLNEQQSKNGDINRNDLIDSLDYILLKRAYFGTFRIV